MLYVVGALSTGVYLYIFNIQCKDKRGENKEIWEGKEKNNFSSNKKNIEAEKNQTSKVYLIPIYIFMYTIYPTKYVKSVISAINIIYYYNVFNSIRCSGVVLYIL